MKLQKPYASPNIRLFFIVKTINNWNSIPEGISTARTLNEFKGALDNLWRNE